MIRKKRTSPDTRRLVDTLNFEVEDVGEGKFLLKITGKSPKGRRTVFKMTIKYDQWPYAVAALEATYKQHHAHLTSSIHRMNAAFNRPS